MSNQPQSSAPQPPAPKQEKKGNPFKDTLNLPQTAFSMKADLVKNEPASLARWANVGGKGLYEALRERAADPTRSVGVPKTFAFHDGPPYANGSIHLGHLMNKCLKDFVVRSKTMAGFDVPYIPGWDCHGLPIEHKVMTELAEAKKLPEVMALPEAERKMFVRSACQAYAAKFVDLHKGQMSRLLTVADYPHPYLTMSKEFEGATLEILATLMERGLVFRALKPVHWSVTNETALADAELEYQDRQDISVYVDFEAADADAVYDAFGLPKAAAGADEVEVSEGKPEPGERPDQRPTFMIWTTTPWTLPANVAIAVNPAFEYALVWVDGNVSVMAAALVEKVTALAKAEEVVVLAKVSGEKLVGLKYRHPFVDASRHQNAFRVVPAAYVTLEDGTGLVHTAPGHGTEDYQTGLANHLPVYCPVLGNGQYDATVPEWLRGQNIWKANKEIVEHLRNSGHLFYDHVFMHSYPHDWRSKTPVIFRCTEQWFVGVDQQLTNATSPFGSTLREMALKSTGEPGAGGAVAFVPEWGRNRMRGMLESRPDWCISRQRAWGLPIPAFLYKDASGSEKAFMTAATVKAVAKLVREEGADVWFKASPADLLKHYVAKSDAEAPAEVKSGAVAVSAMKKGPDILDVWFESGSSWNSAMRERGFAPPVDLYLEGSDQHRGWFQLSLLTALGATGKPPFKTLLTHGFMVGKDGKKLSKSKGDTVDDLMTRYGADVLRWWVSTLAYENDVKVDGTFFDAAGEAYRKVRNTLRFMLSNLYDYTPATRVGDPQDPGLVGDRPRPTSLDAWALAELDRLSAGVTAAYEAYDFRTASSLMFDFCNSTLSAVYLAAVKDRLYCDKPDSARRRSCQAVLWTITDTLCRLLAPICAHTADEAYRALHKVAEDDAATCVHLRLFAAPTGVAADNGWAAVMAVREKAQGVMESSKKTLGVENPLDMGVTLPDPTGELARFDGVDLADLLGVSRAWADRMAGEVKVVDLRGEPRCERSWKRDGTVRARERANGAMLSDRDAQAVGA